MQGVHYILTYGICINRLYQIFWGLLKTCQAHIMVFKIHREPYTR